MTEIRDHFPELENLDIVQLHARRDELRSRGNGDYMTLDDDTLAELLQVNRCLRRKAGATSGAPRSRKAPKTPATLEDLA